MGARRITLLVFALVVCALVPATAQARDYIVGYDESAGSPKKETAQREDDVGFDADYVYSKAIRGFAADLSAAQVEELQNDPDVAYVVRDRPVQATGVTPPAAGETVPPGVRRIGAATTDTVSPKSDVGVAVIDTGIDLANADLDAVDGKNCISPGQPAQDDHGHGTHVAGTIAARNTGAGVVGVVPGSKLYAVKVLDSAGSGSTSSVICGIDWVTANAAALNIKVANMSLGGDASSVGTCLTDPERAAICRSTVAGVNYVVAAGNDGRDIYQSGAISTPAAFPEVLTVSAYGDSDGVPGGTGSPLCASGYSDDAAASFSNYASRPQDVAHLVAAPGVCIRSDKNGGGTTTMSGTSMATPHVAGAVALCLGAGGVAGPCSGLSPAQVIDRMMTTAQSRASTFGFQGDPLRPIAGKVYGYAVNVGGATASTGISSEVGQTSATVSGIVYPADSGVAARFEYGTTTAYGSSTDPQSIAAPSGPTAVATTLSGLQKGTTYHYRLTVSDASGQSAGVDRTFTTTSPAPIIPSTPVTAPVAVPAPPSLPVPGNSTSSPGTSTPVPSKSQPSKTCKTWRARLTKAKKALASSRKAARRRASSAARTKVKGAEASVRRAKLKVKRYC